MPHHLLQASIVVALGVSALAGCGGGGDDGGGGDEFAVYSADDVRARFKALGGVDLQVSESTPGNATLRLPDGEAGQAARRRFGSFLLSVVADEESMERRREFTVGGDQKVVKNVIVRSIGTEDAGYQRTLRIVESLGTPAEQVQLPSEDTPCQKQGIDPDGGTGKTGTCLEQQQAVTVVDAKGPLELPNVTITRLQQRVGRTLTTNRFGLRRTVRAQGAFVAVRVRVENTSDAPLTSLRPDLVINGRRYALDNRNGYSLADPPFPIQPGAVVPAAFLFDVPVAADDPREGGALEFSADDEVYSTPERAGAVGRIRLSPGTGGSTTGKISR